MFTRLPSRKRHKRVYLYIGKQISAGGDQDIQQPQRLSASDQRHIEKLLVENRDLDNHIQRQTEEIQSLKTAIFRCDEASKSVQSARHIPNITEITAPLDREIADVRVQLEKSLSRAAECNHQYHESRHRIEILQKELHEANALLRDETLLTDGVRDRLISTEKQLQENLRRVDRLARENNSLTRTVAQLTDKIQRAETDKDRLVAAEKSRWASAMHEVRQQLVRTQTDLNACRLDSDHLERTYRDKLEIAKKDCDAERRQLQDIRRQLVDASNNASECKKAALRDAEQIRYLQDAEVQCVNTEHAYREQLNRLEETVEQLIRRGQTTELDLKSIAEQKSQCELRLSDSERVTDAVRGELEQLRGNLQKYEQVERHNQQLFEQLGKEEQRLLASEQQYRDLLVTAQNERRDWETQLAAAEQSYTERLQQAANSNQDLIKTLSSEKEALQTRLNELERSTVANLELEQRNYERVAAECQRARFEIAQMYSYLSRQLFIFDTVEAKSPEITDPMLRRVWSTFTLQHRTNYDNARTIKDNIQNIDNQDCSQILTFFDGAVQTFERIRILENVLVNLFEDISGVVRVYVRIRPMFTANSGPPTVSKVGKSVVYDGTLCNGVRQTYGRFFGVIPDDFKNVDVYTGCKGSKWNENDFTVQGHDVPDEQGTLCCINDDATGMCRVFNQIKEGYHIVLFGYGYSGSGKTLSLLGGNTQVGTEPGLLQLAIANSSASSVSLVSIFELTYGQIDGRSKTFNSGKFVSLFRRTPSDSPLKTMPRNMIVDEETSFEIAAAQGGVRLAELRQSSIEASDIFTLRPILDDYRVRNSRIRATPNNPQSSRSHLFIMLEFVFEEVKGYLTVIDMGGREHAIDILDMFLQKPDAKDWQLPSLLMNTPHLYPSYLSPRVFQPQDDVLTWLYDANRYNQDPLFRRYFDNYLAELNETSHNLDSAIEIVKESMFINETINQLTLFFRQKQDPTKSAKDFNMKEHRLPLGVRRNAYDPLKFLAGIPTTTTDRMGMYRMLDRLYKYADLPCKVVMLCNVRQESIPSKYCVSTKETLEFAHSIRST
jgi:hypothetical protein